MLQLQQGTPLPFFPSVFTETKNESILDVVNNSASKVDVFEKKC